MGVGECDGDGEGFSRKVRGLSGSDEDADGRVGVGTASGRCHGRSYVWRSRVCPHDDP